MSLSDKLSEDHIYDYNIGVIIASAVCIIIASTFVVTAIIAVVVLKELFIK